MRIVNNVVPEKQLQMLNVLEFGADNTGISDNTEIMQTLHKTGKKIYYPNGVYLFNGETLDLSGGVLFESSSVLIRNSISDMSIIRFDDEGRLIGLMQNHLELDETRAVRRCGTLVSPPLSKKKINRRADVIAYWYNDFGLQSHLLAHAGWIGWYYWTWNHHNCESNPELGTVSGLKSDPYDSSRHPLLGFYYGDDPVVLDWQSFWLYEYGVKAVTLLADTIDNWEMPSSKDHWIYQLMHNVPNFRNLTYVISGLTPWSQPEDAPFMQKKVRRSWDNVINKIYAKHDNCYFIRLEGKMYPVVNMWEETALKTVFDPHGGIENTAKFILSITKKLRNSGYDGVAFFNRNPISEFETDEMRAMFKSHGALRYECTYVANYVPEDYLSGKYTYKSIVEKYTPAPDLYKIQGTAVSMVSHTPYPYSWKCTGSTPEIFNDWIGKAVSHLEKHPECLPVITCYNVSEWSEGGPGLQPDVKNGFSYLKALKKAILMEEV